MVSDIISAIIWIFTVVSWWLIFEKAGIKGWKAMIPFYEDYIKFKIADKSMLYIPYLAVTAISSVVKVISGLVTILNLLDYENQFMLLDTYRPGLSIAKWLFKIAIIAADIFVGVKIAEKFGKSKKFGVGLGLIPIVFAPILAFGKAQYIESKEQTI